MDKFLVQSLNRQEFNATSLTNKEDWTGKGYLLQVTITGLKEVPKKARYWVGFMAGTSTLDTHYDLLDSNSKNILSWDDDIKSNRSVNNCAQTLNERAVRKITLYFMNLESK
jgi:hypothetical protein